MVVALREESLGDKRKDDGGGESNARLAMWYEPGKGTGVFVHVALTKVPCRHFITLTKVQYLGTEMRLLRLLMLQAKRDASFGHDVVDQPLPAFRAQHVVPPHEQELDAGTKKHSSIACTTYATTKSKDAVGDTP